MPDDETPDIQETTEEETSETTEAKPKDADDPRLHVALRKLEKLEKKLSSLAEEEKEEEETPEPKKVTEDETDFKIFNADRIKNCADEFKELRSKGYDLQDALELAEYRKGITRKEDTETTRQAAEGNDSTTINRATEPDVDVDEGLIEMIQEKDGLSYSDAKKKAQSLKKRHQSTVKRMG